MISNAWRDVGTGDTSMVSGFGTDNKIDAYEIVPGLGSFLTRSSSQFVILGLKFNPSNQGLRKVFNDYQELVLHYVWEAENEGVNSREVWEDVSGQLTERKTISRASINQFLDKLSKLGVLEYREEAVRGGPPKIYHPLMNEDEFVKHIVKTLALSLMKDFPETTEQEILSMFARVK